MWLNALVVSGGIVLLASSRGSASAQETASAYTKIDANHQSSYAHRTAVEDYGSWRCKGYAGIGVCCTPAISACMSVLVQEPRRRSRPARLSLPSRFL